VNDDLLVVVVDRIVPADADPGVLVLGGERYIRGWLDREAADRVLIMAGLETLAAAHPDFTGLSPEARNAALVAVEGEPWFQRLVLLVSEGFYADPANGGNDGAGSWAMIGYQHRLPEGPSGPPAWKRPE
jgi:hypothetical protein